MRHSPFSSEGRWRRYAALHQEQQQPVPHAAVEDGVLHESKPELETVGTRG